MGLRDRMSLEGLFVPFRPWFAVSTLGVSVPGTRFGKRAKKISNKAVVNKERSPEEMKKSVVCMGIARVTAVGCVVLPALDLSVCMALLCCCRLVLGTSHSWKRSSKGTRREKRRVDCWRHRWVSEHRRRPQTRVETMTTTMTTTNPHQLPQPHQRVCLRRLVKRQ